MTPHPPKATGHKVVSPAQHAFNQKVDKAFYEQVKRQNGGTLPPNLAAPGGGARRLTMAPADSAYREQWKAIAEKFRKSSAVVSKGVTSPCVPCQSKAAAAKIPPILLPSKGGKKIQVGPTKVTPAPGAPPKNPIQDQEPCKHQTLIVECSDFGSRKFRLELPPPEHAPDGGGNQLEVIDNGKEKLTCTTKIIAGPCGAIHKTKLFDIYPTDSIETKTDSKLVFKAHHDPSILLRPFSWLFAAAKARSSHSYEVRTNTCEGRTLSATVVVHPQIDFDVDISLGFKDGEESKLEFSGQLTAIVIGKPIKFGPEIKHELEEALELLNLARKTVNFITSVCSNLGGIKVEFKYPQAVFKGTWGWAEIEGSPNCGFRSDITTGFQPLVGASLKLDIFTFLATKFPAVGQMAERLREAANKYVDVAIFFEVEGSVDGTFHYKKEASHTADGSGNLDGTLEFTLEGHVKVDGHYMCLHFGAEVKIGGKASFEGHLSAGSDENGLYGKGGLEFAGLTIYAVVGANGKITFADPPAEESENTEQGGILKNMSVSGKVVYSHDWTVIPKADLLGSDEKHYLFGGGGSW